MLHALLHGKLDECTPEPERLEDALTSTVFGTLVLAGAGDVLADWLGRARRVDGGRRPVKDRRINGVWFWPQLTLAEPDVVLRLGDELFVIEAKYRSDLHDAPPDAEHKRITDQLHRQWASLDPAAVAHSRCPLDLRESILACDHTLLLVVDGRRLRQSTREFRESADGLPPDADLRLLTWQSLHEILMSPSRREATSPWSEALDEYFERVGLQGFAGFRQWAPPFGSVALFLRNWRGSQVGRPMLDLRAPFRVSGEGSDAADPNIIRVLKGFQIQIKGDRQ